MTLFDKDDCRVAFKSEAFQRTRELGNSGCYNMGPLLRIIVTVLLATALATGAPPPNMVKSSYEGWSFDADQEPPPSPPSRRLGSHCDIRSLACAVDHFFNPAVGGCVACPHSTQRNTGSAVCVGCGAGRFISSYSGGCRLCQSGQFSTAGGATSCRYCPSGKYTGAQGATSCSSCPAGKHSPSYGSGGCGPCGRGTFGANAGAPTCSSCPNGKYSATYGEFQSAQGYSYNGISSCTACPAGTVSNMAQGATSCSSIPSRRLSATECDPQAGAPPSNAELINKLKELARTVPAGASTRQQIDLKIAELEATFAGCGDAAAAPSGPMEELTCGSAAQQVKFLPFEKSFGPSSNLAAELAAAKAEGSRVCLCH